MYGCIRELYKSFFYCNTNVFRVRIHAYPNIHFVINGCHTRFTLKYHCLLYKEFIRSIFYLSYIYLGANYCGMSMLCIKYICIVTIFYAIHFYYMTSLKHCCALCLSIGHLNVNNSKEKINIATTEYVCLPLPEIF